jgi:hypothetical protein
MSKYVKIIGRLTNRLIPLNKIIRLKKTPTPVAIYPVYPTRKYATAQWHSHLYIYDISGLRFTRPASFAKIAPHYVPPTL